MRKLTADELFRESKVEKRADFYAAIKQRYNYSFTLTEPCNPNPKDTNNNYDLTFDEVDPTVPEADIVDEKGPLLHPTSMSYALMNAEVLLPQGEDMRLVRVIWQSVDYDGKVIGKHNDIPILNTIMYGVELPYGAVKLYAANIITENILNQVDKYEYHNQLINTILEN